MSHIKLQLDTEKLNKLGFENIQSIALSYFIS